MLEHLHIRTFTCSLCSRTYFNEDCFLKDQLKHRQLTPKLEPPAEQQGDLSPRQQSFEADDYVQKRENQESSDRDADDDL